jgi:D-amino-acid dehydrogenase
MKIAVIGAGVVGICTAYELALDGHAVTVYERHGSVAEEASFACAGHLSPSLSHPLAFPAWPQDTSRWRALLKPAGIALGGATSLPDLRWLAGWRVNPKDFRKRFDAAQQLVRYSLERQQRLTAHADLAFEQGQGQLLLLRSERDVAAQQNYLDALKAQGVVAHVLTTAQARTLEPALGSEAAVHAAIHFPGDAVGNCRQFAHALKEQALEIGVAFRFAASVRALSNTPTIQVHTDRGAEGFDHAVVCAGASAATLLGPALMQVALTGIASYSLSAQIREPLNAPRHAVIDGYSHISISRMGARIRVSGGAELGGTPRRNRASSTRLLYQTLQTHFPGAADFSRSMQLWRGSSVFSPDALPLVGPSNHPGIWLNVAHGHNGWSMACGAARIVADQIGGRPPDLNTTLLHPGRFKS